MDDANLTIWSDPTAEGIQYTVLETGAVLMRDLTKDDIYAVQLTPPLEEPTHLGVYGAARRAGVEGVPERKFLVRMWAAQLRRRKAGRPVDQWR